MAIANHDNYDVFEALFFKNDVFYSIFDTLDFFAFQICRILQYIWHTGIFRPTVDHDNYDKFDKNDTYNNVNYDILKIEALGYHDNYDVFEKYFLKQCILQCIWHTGFFHVANMSYFTRT